MLDPSALHSDPSLMRIGKIYLYLFGGDTTLPSMVALLLHGFWLTWLRLAAYVQTRFDRQVHLC